MRIVLLFLLFAQTTFSQNQIKGKIMIEASSLNKIYIINYSNKNEATADNQGYFKISAKPKDTLIFSGVNIKGRQIVLKQEDFSEDLFFVKLKLQPYELDEILVQNYPHINAVDLGIVSKDTKSYTRTERKLKAAGGLIMAEETGGVALNLGRLFNNLSGQTAILQKELEVERKEKQQEKLMGLFSEKFYTEVLHLPLEYVKGFVIYALDDKNITRQLNAKKTKLVEILLKEKVMNYLEIIDGQK